VYVAERSEQLELHDSEHAGANSDSRVRKFKTPDSDLLCDAIVYLRMT